MAVSFIIPTVSIGESLSSTVAGSRPVAVGSRPRLVVLEGGRSPSAMRRTYFFRRVVVIALVALCAGGAVAATGLASGSRRSTGAIAPDRSAPTLPATYEVRPGDTLWEIAGTLDVDVDRRVIVQVLADANGGPVLQPGQNLAIPAVLSEI